MEERQLKHLEIEIGYAVQMDEFWSFVGSKSNQRWTWYAMEKQTGIIVAWHNGKRTDDDLKELIKIMKPIPVQKYYTDEWGAYTRLLPDFKHITDKGETWKIERKNLNFRIHIKRLSRKTICYSKNEKIHDNVIGCYIQRFYFANGAYADYHIN